MSERAHRCRRGASPWVVAAALATGALGAQAQAPSADAVRIAARVRLLNDSAARMKSAHDSAVAASRGLLGDTVRVGPFTIAADARYIALARAGADSAWASVRPYYGERRVAAANANTFFVIHADSVSRLLFTQHYPRLGARTGGFWDADQALDGVAQSQTGAVAAFLADRVRTSVDAHTDRALALWSVIPPAAADVRRDVVANAFLQLQTAASIPARGCSAGVLAQCASALGLVVPLEPIEQIFTPDEMRAIARQEFEAKRNFGAKRDERPNPCNEGVPGDGCDRYVRSIARTAFPPPMGTETRGALIVTALELGGTGALDRLLADSTAPLLARLASAGGVQPDTLLARWRTRVLSTRPAPVAPPATSIVAALIWGIGLAALSLRLVRLA